MAELPPQDHDKIKAKIAAPATPDFYSFLISVIDTASRDPAQLRKLVYAMVWHSLKPETVSAQQQPSTLSRSQTLHELQQTLEFERAVARIESDATQDYAEAEIPSDRGSMYGQKTMRENGPADEEISLQGFDTSPSEDAETLRMNTPGGEVSNPSSVVVIPNRPQEVLLPAKAFNHQPPSWLNHRVHVSVEMTRSLNERKSDRSNLGFLPFLQLIAASVIGVVLYVGISGWVQPAWQAGPQSTPAPASPSAPLAASALPGAREAGNSHLPSERLSRLQTQLEASSSLSFPLPKTYGIYAGVNGQLTELTTLPVKIPDPRVRLSAEIKTPSQVVIAGSKPTFIFYRRDLLNNAPQTVSVRVVARVTRDMRFVDGKPLVTAIQGSWRITMKAYQLKVAPLEGHPEMITAQSDPEFAFPPGRYALVLNGTGYDFTVQGTITSPEQCLEQAEMLNGTVLSECARS